MIRWRMGLRRGVNDHGGMWMGGDEPDGEFQGLRLPSSLHRGLCC